MQADMVVLRRHCSSEGRKTHWLHKLWRQTNLQHNRRCASDVSSTKSATLQKGLSRWQSLTRLYETNSSESEWCTFQSHTKKPCQHQCAWARTFLGLVERNAVLHHPSMCHGANVGPMATLV